MSHKLADNNLIYRTSLLRTLASPLQPLPSSGQRPHHYPEPPPPFLSTSGHNVCYIFLSRDHDTSFSLVFIKLPFYDRDQHSDLKLLKRSSASFLRCLLLDFSALKKARKSPVSEQTKILVTKN